MDTHGASRIFKNPSRIIPPQVAVGGLTPKPIKLDFNKLKIFETSIYKQEDKELWTPN